MRLAARVHLELELRVVLGEAGEQRPELGLRLAGDQSQDVARLAEQAVDDRAGDRVEARAAGDRVAAGQAEKRAGLDLQCRRRSPPSKQR